MSFSVLCITPKEWKTLLVHLIRVAYIREGTALQQLGQHADALAAFAAGLAQDNNNTGLLTGLIDAAIKCPLKEKLEPIFQQLQQLKLDKSPFVIISVIGQELLQAGHYHASTQMLEAALKIGTCSLKLRGSVFSALSSGYWGLGNIDKAITYMQKDLQVAKNLGDAEGECRAYGNLGSAYFSKGHYKEALSHDRFQLVLAMRLKDRQTATVALGRLGHVYTAIGDYPNALQSHKQCVLLLKQSNEKLSEAREIGNVGAVYLAMGNFESAVECHLEHLKIAKSLKNSVEEARAYSNLGSAYHYKRNYEKAIVYHKQVLKVAEQKSDKSLEARAYAGLGHAARCMQDYNMSKTYHEKQLDNALQTRDRVAEGRACSNLGIIYHQLAEYDAALKLHKVHLSIAKELSDRASQGRALGNIGNAYCALNQFEQAIKYNKQELAISTEVNDRHSEGSTHGNLAVAYQTLKMYDSAHQHYVAHLNISRELKDSQSEARAVCNLGNFHSSRGEYTNSIPYYEQYLMLSQELHDSEGEAKACFCLGYAHFALGNFLESVRYYKQDLSIAQELKNQLGIARAYCNLGLAHKALNSFTEALDCQKKCLNLMTSLKNVKGHFRSLGNIGDILLKTGDTSEAIKFYNQQLTLAKQCNSQDMLASANGALGSAHRVLAQYDKALAFHTQELSIRQDMNDLKGECRAHGHLGSVHMCLGKYMNAFKCYEEQLEKSRELQDSAMEANACGNLAITKMNMGNFEEAIGLFEQQLAMLEQVHGNNATFDKGRAFGNLGDCYEALGDFDESIKCHEQYLAIAQNAGHLSDQDKAYRGLGNAHRSVGNLQQALVCFEKRLVVAHELNSHAAKASAYGELGCLHSLLGNFEQAISCLQHQLTIAQEMQDSLCEGDAACGLGGVYQQMGEYDKALEYHEMDLKIAENTNNTACQCRAYGNLGLSHESLGEYTKAIKYQEQHLSIAAQMNDRVAKTLAYSSLGRVHHALNNHKKAVEYLRQGLQIAEQLGRMEDEAKIRHRLGLALWGNNDHEECQQQLYKASELFESIRRDAQFNSEYKLSLFDLQTACYQALQRVLVTLDRHPEALVVAERACTRAFIDLLMERQAGSEGFYGNHVTDPPPITTDQILNIVQKQKSMVLYFSVASGFLYSWLLTPRDGIVKFHVTSMTDIESEVDAGDNISMKSSVSFSACSLLDNMVGQVRESMGVESHAPSGLSRTTPRSVSVENDSTSDIEDHFEQQLEELGDKLNAENDRTGFLRIVNRNHLYNSSNYSLGSMFSLNVSLNASFPGATISRKNSVRSKFGNKSAVSALYQLLIEPFEESMKEITEDAGSSPSDLILVLQGDLFLIPFSVLRKDQTMEYLYERFNLIVVPSLTSLQNTSKHDKHGRPVIDSSGAVVVGNPKLTPSICQHWHLHDIPSSEYEARIVGEILTARPLIGHEATKGAVLNQIEQVEVIHFATHISWKLSSVILSPGEVPSHPPARFPTIDSDDSASDISSFDGPSLAEYLLTAADILNLKLHAKLVILSSGYTDDRAGRINTDGVVGLTRSLLSAGAQSVLYCLWPVPDQASKLLMRTLYIGLQEGKCVSQALTFAVKTVQSTKQFSHPSNWGGWVLIGQDVKLSSKVAQMGHAICELLQHPNQCREAMRVLLHLIEKSLQRIHQGSKNSMYTTAQSIENKVGGLSGWKDLLQAVGFRFEPSLNGLPPAVFFPQSDPGDRLTQASASLQALLGLPPGSSQALSKFLHNYEAGEAIIRVMRDILSKMAAKDTNMDVKVNVKLWRVAGCHEFLASLSMDLVEVGNDEVTLRLGKQANKRQLQFALQSLVAVFDTQEAPCSLNLDSSSSLESLSSSHSGSTSTSNFSKGSTPPISPRGKKKSLFNPAEMEKMRIRNTRMSQGGLTGRKIGPGKSTRAGATDPATYLQYQNQIKYMYRSETLSPPYGNEVSVVALSDSDTTASPTLGSSSASEKLRDLQNAESFNLSFDGKSDKSSLSGKSDKLHSPDVKSMQSSLNGDEGDDTSADNETVIIHDESDGSFKRNGENRNSDISDNSSISQGIQADKDLSKLGSDMSDVSMSEGRLTPKNRQDLENYLQVTDESGIVSENTSSNHSEASQQSEHTSYRFDPSEIAQKIMSDVSEHKTALDSMQKFSMMQAQAEAHILRTEYQKQNQQVILASSGENNSTAVHDNVSKEQNTVQSKLAAFSGNNISQSAFTSPSHKSRLPPPVASKPTFQSNTPGVRNSSANVSNLSAIPKSSSAEALVEQISFSPSSSVQKQSSSSVPVTPVSSSVFTTTAIMVSKQDSFSSSASAGTTMSFSSFRPGGKPPSAENVASVLHHRPDSTTSTSSYCSTPSSMQSVIYRPYGDKRIPDSPCVVSYDSSSEQTSGSGSASTITPTVNMTEKADTIQNDVISSLKRDSSPALSSCSSTSGKSGKQKKKVSFSDSEPSDTPSPLDSSASSNQLSYFDLKKSSFGNIPPRTGNMQPQLQMQKSHQNSSNSSLDSAGKLAAGNSQRPPPPSYQYAIRNSQLLQNKTAKPGILQQSPRQSYSSNSSLNSSLDEVGRLPPSQTSPVRTSGNQPSFQQQNQSESNSSYILNQSLPAGSSFTQNLSQYPNPNQSYPPQNLSNRVPRNQGLSPVRNPGLSPVRSPGISPVRQNPAAPQHISPEQTPVIPPRGIAPTTRPNYMKIPDETISPGQQMQSSRSYVSGPITPGQGHMSRGQLLPNQQYSGSLTHMTAIREQIPSESSSRPNSLQMNNPALSPTKSALVRQPLSPPEGNLSPQEYFPRPPDQFRGSGYIDNQQGQKSMTNTFSQMNYQRSQSMDFLSRNAQNDQNKLLSQSYEMKDFPSKFSSSQSLNQISPSHTRNGPPIPSASQIRETLVNRNASANHMYSGQSAANRNTERRNPPVPPARIDSWENMDKHLNEQRIPHNHVSNHPINNTFQQFYEQSEPTGQKQNGQVVPNNPNKIVSQNGYLPGREQTNQMFNSQTKVYPMNNSLPQSHHNFANGNIPNLQLNPTNVGPLRRVGIGSDKKSFAKSNVIQASKC
ncbi:tetratricopeptide repeat protein 28-like isoform X2 [Mercenaria mercenaria]|uniref:tetratricopeptide repeat protein 28-like isoform X2 n=1 Tax=Mercenaria mercenaria TaxID=6596 RepID=UPI00234E4426|nr:tetratricopeptide repeat protein 28-like isoform X2 [Mercenaria mercenaria]